MIKSNVVNRNIWSKVTLGPPDAILGITEAYKKDTNSSKINLGVGAYRDNEGNPYVLNCVRRAEKIIEESKFNKEYLPIAGLKNFVDKAKYLAFKDSVDNKIIASVQTLSGTGALRLGGEFINRFYESKEIYLPNFTWGNHIPIFKDSKLQVKTYKYYDPKSISLDIESMLKDLREIKNNSVILLHTCAHNPTGVDPTIEQWKMILEAIKSKNHLPFFDMAYQGFATGDINKDAEPVRMFSKTLDYTLLAQSFAKNMGLYGERVGLFSIKTNNQNKDEVERINSQLKILIRPMYSNPPINGARIASLILNDATLFNEWLEEIKLMSSRIIDMRRQLKSKLESLSVKSNRSNGSWDHITNQIGMFCYTGLNKEQIEILVNKYHVYLTKDGRISMAGVTTSNVDYLAESIKKVS